MKTPTIYRADYTDWNGTDCRVYVRVHASAVSAGEPQTFYAYHPHKLGCGKDASTLADAVRRLLNDHGWFKACREMPGPLADLKTDISRAYQEALQKAKRITGHGFHRSRGRWVVVTKRSDCVVGAGEWEFTGTAKQMADIMHYAFDPEITGVYIEGGVDFADSLQDFNDGAYDPWVAEWSVCLFQSEVENLKGE